ncbi:DNA processing protein DprA [Halopiger xanaduensis]|uniref:SMF family protein n=1 Tax=Halopiger xanaduensis (strain DSM 18323 / JCM 14033 / SH-6) TaxID=797210 RepID=F8DDS2_HALXS|nr:DNA processing protein DprA [Halopiger xanaduensis]AEH39175.1 SMF family protein [Halopiger xanaduensis SH-6]
MNTHMVIAALNDEYKLNSQRMVDLLRDANEKKPLEEVDINIFKDLIRAKSLSDDDIAPLAKKALSVLNNSDWDFYEDYIRDVEEKGMKVISILDKEYPSQLLRIQKPPLQLYINGDPQSWNDAIAVVGTREAHDHRIKFVEEIGEQLVNGGHTVVSGLANGVDESAHRSAIESNGDTIAVLPSHIENIYPKSNVPLGEEIPSNGALISEVTSKIGIHRGRFVERNRITSGLCKAVIIGASGDSGGTVHQAKFADSQNIPIFLYDPKNGDGQSPDKLDKYGVHRFESLEELEDLVQSLENESRSGHNYTLNEYSN